VSTTDQAVCSSLAVSLEVVTQTKQVPGCKQEEWMLRSLRICRSFGWINGSLKRTSHSRVSAPTARKLMQHASATARRPPSTPPFDHLHPFADSFLCGKSRFLLPAGRPLLKRLQNVWARSTHAHSHSNRSRTTHCEDFVSCPPKSPVCCRLGYKTGSTETAVFLSLLSSPTRGLGFDPKPLQTSTRLGPDS